MEWKVRTSMLLSPNSSAFVLVSSRNRLLNVINKTLSLPGGKLDANNSAKVVFPAPGTAITT